jgi:L-malate glycosyltransferase
MAEKKIKALWLASWFPNRKDVLSGNFVEKQAQALANQCDIVVLFITDDDIDTYQIETEHNDFITIRVYHPKTTNRILKLFRFINAWRKGLKMLKKYGFKMDIVHLHVLNPTGLVALYLYFFKRVPFVVTEHWSGYNQRIKANIDFHHRLLMRMCGRFSSRILGLSAYFVESMRACGMKGHFSIIPNIVNVEIFCPNLEKGKTNKFRMLHISHLFDPHKNLSQILKAIHVLAQKRQDFQLTIVGNIERQKPYVSLSKVLKINHLITFKPTLNYKEIALEMQNHDAFVMFSNFEGLPVVILEALSVGIPVVASETGGIREWIDEEKGRVIEVGDFEGFITALEDIILKKDTFLPQKIRQNVVEKCSNEQVSGAILKVYHEVLA